MSILMLKDIGTVSTEDAGGGCMAYFESQIDRVSSAAAPQAYVRGMQCKREQPGKMRDLRDGATAAVTEQRNCNLMAEEKHIENAT